MADHFESARLRLEAAKENIAHLNDRIEGFFDKHPATPIVENNPKTRDHTLKVKFAPQPRDWPVKTAEILEHLRHTLDQTIYAAARASGVDAPRNAYFPFSDTPENLENVIKGRCTDVPKEILALARAFQPYKGGNFTLWALNKAANTKHTRLMPVGVGAADTYVKNLAISSKGPFVMRAPRWDRTKNEIIVIEAGAVETVDYELAVSFTVAFDEVEPVAGQPIIGVLNAMARVVESILVAIEAETHRLFPQQE